MTAPDTTAPDRAALAVPLMAALAAAISLLERSSKTAAPSDKMFDQMLDDYRGVLEQARSAAPAEEALRGADGPRDAALEQAREALELAILLIEDAIKDTNWTPDSMGDEGKTVAGLRAALAKARAAEGRS